MKKIVRLTESDLSRIVRQVISEDMEVSDLERKQLSDKMIKDMIDKYYLDDVVNPTTKVPYRPYNVGGKLDYNKAYREYMEAIDQKLTELGFPNGVNIPENISRQEFDNLKNKWTQSSSKLTENDLSRIVKRVLNEQTQNDITLLSNNLLYKSLENWYGSPQWMNAFPGSTGWKENMSRNESSGKENHPCLMGEVEYEVWPPKFLTQDTEIPERCKTFLKNNYTDYLNKFLIKNGFVNGFNVTTQDYAQVKKQYDTLQKTNGWKK